jgi:hypothetical protein
MPTTYTHYRFGKDVYKQLDISAQEMVDSFRGLYDIGLHGPDLLFYYQALSKNPVNQTGFAMHQKPGRDFFEYAKSVLKTTTAPKPAMAYLYGFLCHFALDSNCHPYIEQMVRKLHLSHSAIEAELDRFFMEKDGLNPITYRPTAHLNPCTFHARVIAPFFPGIEDKKIRSCIRSIRFYCNRLVIPNPLLRWLTLTILRLTQSSESTQDMIIRYETISECTPVCLHLESLYDKAVTDAVALIENWSSSITSRTPLDKRYDHTFGEF